MCSKFRLAISNISLPSFNHEKELHELSQLGFMGLEVAPSKVWSDCSSVSFADVESYRRQVQNAGLCVVGLHSLFYDMPNINIFSTQDSKKAALRHLIFLSNICSDLGGETLVFGSPKARNKGRLSLEEADRFAVLFFQELCTEVASDKTIFCFEPLRRFETDYMHSALHALRLVHLVNLPGFQIQIDAKSLVDLNELTPLVFNQIKSYLCHIHINEPDLGILQTDGAVDHQTLAGLLNAIGYKGFVSLEQRMMPMPTPLDSIRMSSSVLSRYYQ